MRYPRSVFTLPRTLESHLQDRLKKTPKSVLLIGPRQTGKSTLLRQLEPRLEINLSNESVYRAHLKDDSLLAAQVHATPPKSVILIDEIQRIPSMLNTVQSLIEDSGKYRFLLTGSSARKLKRGPVNLLPGRLFRYDLFPLTYWELADQWDLQKALTRGTLPEIYLADYGPELLANYVDSYLREEIQAEALTRSIQSFARFLDVAAQSSGQILNYSQLSSDSEIPKETLRRYMDILEDTLLIHRISGYAAIRGSRKAIQKEKVLFFDMGVRNAVLGQHENVFSEPELGPLFEQWIINQVIAFGKYHQKNWKIFFYRDDLKREVDLVVERESDLLAVEIKYAKRVESKDLNGLIAFQGVAKKKVVPIVVYRGEEMQRRGDCQIFPYRKFLEWLAATCR